MTEPGRVDQHKSVVRVVVASPGDVGPERDRLVPVVEELNRGIADLLGLTIELWRWETDASPGFHVEGPQGRIDELMRIDQSDVVIGIFWHRMGTPTADSRSGTEHELRRAITAWREGGRPQVLVYFSEKPYTPKTSRDAAQWQAVLEFRENFPPEGLYWTYKGVRQFEKLAREHLTRLVREIGGADAPPSGQVPAAPPPAPVYPGERQDYRAASTGILDFYSRVFVGREAELQRLTAFAAQEAPGYLIVEAPAGYGKTALIAQLVARRRAGRWDGLPLPQLVYFLIRSPEQRHTPAAFLRAANSQLLDLLGLPGGLPTDIDALRDQFCRLWAAAVHAATHDMPLLLLVDGLDEMAPPDASTSGLTIATLLPDTLGPYVHAVVTSRPNPRPLAQVAWEHPLRHAVFLRVQVLGEKDVAELLRQAGGDEALAPQVWELTRGEPLFARFVCEDVAREGRSAVAQLERKVPGDVEDYFHQQLAQLQVAADGKLTRDALGLLYVALGGITVEEIAGALNAGPWDVQQALRPVQRYLLGEERLELMHLQLRKVLAGQFTAREQQGYERRLLAWCQSYAVSGWPDDTPGYVRSHYAGHLYARRNDAAERHLSELINQAWMGLRYRGDAFTYTGFLSDVDLAWQAAIADPSHDPVFLVRLQTARQVVNWQVSRYTDADLQTLVWLDRADEALAHARLRLNLVAKCAGLLAVYEVLKARGQPDDSILSEVLETANSVQGWYERAWALGDLAKVLVQTGHWDEARRLIDTIGDEWERILRLCGLVRALAETGDSRFPEVLAEACRTVDAIQDVPLHAAGLTEMAWALMESGRFEEARQVAGSIEHDYLRAWALLNLAGLVTAADILQAREIIDEAWRAAAVVDDNYWRAKVLGQLTGVLIQAGDSRMGRALEEAQVAIRMIGDARERTWALREMAEVLIHARDDRATEILAEALQIASSVLDDWAWGECLRRIVCALAEVGDLDDARDVAAGIENGEWRARALADVAAGLSQVGRFEEARQVVRAVQDDHEQARVLRHLVGMLTLAGRLEEAREVAKTVQNDSERERLLGSMVTAMAQSGRLDEAQQVLRPIPSGHIQAEEIYAEVQSAGYMAEDSPWRAHVLSNMAEALVQAGQLAEAQELLAEAQEVACSIQNDFERAYALSDVAEALAQAGQLAEAQEVARSIQNDVQRAHVLSNMAKALAQAGQLAEAQELLAEAQEVARLIQNDVLQAYAVSDVAEALVQAEELAEAQEAARSIQDAVQRAHALGRLAEALAQAGHVPEAQELLAEAQEVARSIQNDNERVRGLSYVAEALVQAGQLAEAQEMLAEAQEVTRSIQNDNKQAYALSDVAKALVQAEELAEAQEMLAEAQEVARSIQDDNERAHVLGRLAEALAQAGHVPEAQEVLSEAQEVARSIQDDVVRVRALSDVAKALAQAGQLAEALVTLGPRGPSEFLGALADWTSAFERIRPGLSFAALCEAIRVTGWVLPGWRSIYEKVAAAMEI